MSFYLARSPSLSFSPSLGTVHFVLEGFPELAALFLLELLSSSLI
jgi:hypothetical protein